MVIKSAFIELLEYFTKRFAEKMGRAPQTPSELMSIQNDAVRHLNKTKGNPKKLTPQSMINERYRAANPFIGFKPTVVQGGKSKEGIGTLLKDSPEAIAKIKADNKAAVERLKKKKTDNPEDMASGGIARVGYAAGKLVKGASWVINKLKEQLFDMDLGIGGSRFSKLSSTQKEGFKNELKTLIKQLEQGGEIPNEMLDTMIADPKFKSVIKTRSTDKDLFELEGVLLDRQAGKQADQIVDDVFGPFDADGKLNKKAVLQEVKDAEEKMLLDKFDVKDRMKNASGGRASRGLNYLLGEDDQNVRMPSPGGVPGLLGE